jgi:hypothetical protein
VARRRPLLHLGRQRGRRRRRRRVQVQVGSGGRPAARHGRAHRRGGRRRRRGRRWEAELRGPVGLTGREHLRARGRRPVHGSAGRVPTHAG